MENRSGTDQTLHNVWRSLVGAAESIRGQQDLPVSINRFEHAADMDVFAHRVAGVKHHVAQGNVHVSRVLLHGLVPAFQKAAEHHAAQAEATTETPVRRMEELKAQETGRAAVALAVINRQLSPRKAVA